MMTELETDAESMNFQLFSLRRYDVIITNMLQNDDVTTVAMTQANLVTSSSCFVGEDLNKFEI